MPRFSISYPCKVVTQDLLASFSSVVVAASKVDAEIIVGVQDYSNSDLNLLDFLSEQPYTIIIDSSSSSNLSGTLNRIIESSSGRYLVRTDNDDLMHPLRISSLSNVIDQLTNFSILGQAYKCFRGRRLGPLIIPDSNTMRNKTRLLLGVPFAHPAITIDLKKVGLNPYDETQNYAQDYMLYVDKIDTGRYIADSSMATYYNMPSFTASQGEEQKRRNQLIDHERAMFKLWSRLCHGLVTKEDIHIIRCVLVTNEFSTTDISNKRNYCQRKLEYAASLMRNMIQQEVTSN